MASFKGDQGYCAYHDDAWYNPIDSSDDENWQKQVYDPSRKRNLWLNEHHEDLAEMFRVFRCTGEAVFGRAFFQFGDFSQFVDLVYENTLLVNADLLKARVVQQHVSTLGSGTRSKPRLHDAKEADT